MKRLIFLLGLFVFLSGVISAQWVSNYGGQNLGDNDYVNAKGLADIVDDFDNCYVTGYCNNSNGHGDDIITIKYAPNGDTLWVKTYNGSGYSEDRAFGITRDALDNIYVTGYASIYGEGADIIVIKYNTSGVLQWAVTYNGAGNMDDKAFGIAVDAVGNIYVTGYCVDTGNDTNIVTIMYNSSGIQQWAAEYNGPDRLTDKAFGMALDNLGNIYVTGFSQSLANGNDVIVIKYNILGQQQWAARYDKGHLDDQSKCITTDASGNIYVAGFCTPANNNIDCLLLKYNSLGQLQWSKTYNDGGSGSLDKAFGIAVDAVLGSIYITGQSGLSTNTNYVTQKYSLSGTRLWTASYNGTGNGNDEANAIALLPNGNVVVTGSTLNSSNNYDYTTIRYDATMGTQLQVVTYSMAWNSTDIATDLAVNSTGTVDVTGYSVLLINGPVNPSYISTQSIQMGERTEINTVPNTPSQFALYQNYPNPFNPTTTIKFDVVKASNVKLAIYDILGKEVTILVNEFMNAGTYDVVFTSNNITSGTYFYVLTAGEFKDVKKMTIVK